MINVKKLRKVIRQKGSSPRLLSKQIGVDTSTLYRRFNNNGKDFTIAEAKAISDALKLSNKEFWSIFFAE